MSCSLIWRIQFFDQNFQTYAKYLKEIWYFENQKLTGSEPQREHAFTEYRTNTRRVVFCHNPQKNMKYLRYQNRSRDVVFMYDFLSKNLREFAPSIRRTVFTHRSIYTSVCPRFRSDQLTLRPPLNLWLCSLYEIAHLTNASIILFFFVKSQPFP